MNLLTNAVKYTSQGGVVFKVSMMESDSDVCQIIFSVKDTGIGVKSDDLDKMFSAYERFDEKKNSDVQGTGLGLDISRQFAELMGGNISCESVYGEGSEFVFTVSQKVVDASAIGVFDEDKVEELNGPYVPSFVAPDAAVLVVDDNPMNLNVVKGLLAPTKVFVSTAGSGEECLEKLKEGKFDVVFLDYMMPGMDGLETLGYIRQRHPDLPVYVLTANSESGGEQFYISKGFTGYLSKPINTVALEKAIRKHLKDEIVMDNISE